MSNKGLSRRDFLKATAAAAAAAVTARAVPLASAAPARQATYNEAPMLAELVAAGQLPPVDQRLPVNPRVITPTHEVGQYGGVLRRAFKGLSDRWGPVKLSEEGAIQWDAPDPENPTLVVNYISEWSQNEDATQYTFKLREGLKWSDGMPFTTADIQFYFDKIYVPQMYTRPGGLNVGLTGEGDAGIVQLEVLDELTWRLTFSVPNPLFILLWE
jgi:peptide/nickel transport system substrate-binding protein